VRLHYADNSVRACNGAGGPQFAYTHDNPGLPLRHPCPREPWSTCFLFLWETLRAWNAAVARTWTLLDITGAAR